GESVVSAAVARVLPWSYPKVGHSCLRHVKLMRSESVPSLVLTFSLTLRSAAPRTRLPRCRSGTRTDCPLVQALAVAGSSAEPACCSAERAGLPPAPPPANDTTAPRAAPGTH